MRCFQPKAWRTRSPDELADAHGVTATEAGPAAQKPIDLMISFTPPEPLPGPSASGSPLRTSHAHHFIVSISHEPSA
jgi:hypothetical protein